MSLRIYGASDDLVEIEGDVQEEIGCYDTQVTLEIGGLDGGIRVIADYGVDKAAVWRLALEPVDEDVPVPWPVRTELGGRGYSLVIIVDCPPGTPIYHVPMVGESRRLT
jgi:hypothetical protein